ncbi:MAG: MFS transporter [Oscillospiraceae bacterium]|nr:MFS transporter [Oscillospiraceae bacterium]
MVILRRIFKSPFGPLYDEGGLSQSLRRSLRFIILGNLFGNIFFNMTQGSALTGFAGVLGANDFVFGVLMAIPLFGTLMQLPAAMIVSRAGKRKKFMMTYGVIARASWIVVGLVPYFVPIAPHWLRLWSVIFLVGISSLGGSFINVCFTPWLADLVPLHIRGRWISCRDRIISLIGVGVGIGTAAILDFMPGYNGYAVVFILGGVLGVADMLCFLGADETPMAKADDTKLIPVMKQACKDKRFFSFMMFWTAWAFATNFGGAFVMRYALGPMRLSFLEATLTGQVAAAVITVFVISGWGRVMDRYGSKPVLMISCFMGCLTPAILLFASPGVAVVFLLFNVIGATFWSAFNLAAVNMSMSCSPTDRRAAYIALFSCVTNLFGAFFGVLLGGAVLEWLPILLPPISTGGLPDQYKIVFILSIILRLLAVFLLIPKLQNDRESSIHELAADLKEWLKDLKSKRPRLRLRRF